MTEQEPTFCPTCKRRYITGDLTRICGKCQKPIERHDKFHFVKIQSGKKILVTLEHRHCDNPQSYRPLPDTTA